MKSAYHLNSSEYTMVFIDHSITIFSKFKFFLFAVSLVSSISTHQTIYSDTRGQ